MLPPMPLVTTHFVVVVEAFVFFSFVFLAPESARYDRAQGGTQLQATGSTTRAPPA